MTISQVIDNKLGVLVGSKLTTVNLYANITSLHFELDDVGFALHIQSYLRIIHENRIIVTSSDYFIYDDEDETGTVNDLWINMEIAKKHIVGSEVLAIKPNDFGDVDIILTNDSRVEIKISNSKTNFSEQIEQYRFFITSGDGNHFVMYSSAHFDE